MQDWLPSCPRKVRTTWRLRVSQTKILLNIEIVVDIKNAHLVGSPVQKVYLALGILGYSYSTYETPTFSYEL